MTGLPIRKIYIDSRYKTSNSASDSDFNYQLSKSTFFPANSMFCIDEINVPYAWNTIELSINDQLYLVWQPTDQSPLVYTVLTLTSNRYTGTALAAEIASEINIAVSSVSNVWSAVYNTSSNTITLSSSAAAFFRILSDAELANLPSTAFPNMSPYNFKSCNDIIQIFPNTASGRTGVPITTGFLNLLNYQDLYITSASLGNFDVMGVRGESSVIRKICVDSQWGYSIIDKLNGAIDWLDCSKQSLDTLDFQFRDVRGNIIPLHGAHLSFTIRFTQG
jgi:hypothetical protein